MWELCHDSTIFLGESKDGNGGGGIDFDTEGFENVG